MFTALLDRLFALFLPGIIDLILSLFGGLP